MEIKQLKNTIRIYDIDVSDIMNLLKCNCKMKLVAYNSEHNVIDFVYLLDRTDKKQIIISKALNAVKKEIVSYREACDIITDTIRGCSEYVIVVDKKLYNSKKVLFDIIPLMSNKLRNALISIDYNSNIFILKFKSDSNFNQSVYFWPSTQDIYLFLETGPIWAYFNPETDAPRSIEKLIMSV